MIFYFMILLTLAEVGQVLVPGARTLMPLAVPAMIGAFSFWVILRA
jgi:hypothetical protein